MPLTVKGKAILRKLRAEYGDTRGTGIFWKLIRSGKLKGLEKEKTDANT